MSTFNKRSLLPPSGFPELTIGESVALRDVTEIIRQEYELAGFTPLETSIVERPEILYAKSAGDILSQGYGLRLLNPAPSMSDDSKDLGLRYDHTVPLARFVAAHYNNIPFPYRRYSIGPVFRGERAKDGRYRQFTQADIDIIGNGSLHLAHDAEMVAVVSRVFKRLNLGDFTIRIGHRKILQGLLEVSGVTDLDSQVTALQEIDRLEKVPRKTVIDELGKIGITAESADLLIDTLQSSNLDVVEKYASQSKLLATGVEELKEVLSAIAAYNVDPTCYTVDLTIARGLAYYTGTVYETRLDAHPSLGSIASGGRYEDLASHFIDRSLPGVGISIGLTRLMKRLIQTELYPALRQTVAPVFIAQAFESADLQKVALGLASTLRAQNIGTEVYVEPAKLGKQLMFAEKKGFTWAIILKQETLDDGTVILKNLATGVESAVALHDICSLVT